MTNHEIRAWLMAMPRPVLLVVTTEDGQRLELPCGSGAGVGWKKLSETIHALAWMRLEAYGKDEALIRACQPKFEESEDAPASPASPARAVVVPPGADGETQRLIIFANLIAEAYKHSNTEAFARLSEMISSSMERADRADQTRESYYRAQIKQLESALRAAGAEVPQTDLLSAMMGQFLGGMQGAAHRPAANGADHEGEA